MRAPQRSPGRNGFKYRPQFGVIVLCKDEAHQSKVFQRLTLQGYKLKVVCV